MFSRDQRCNVIDHVRSQGIDLHRTAPPCTIVVSDHWKSRSTIMENRRDRLLTSTVLHAWLSAGSDPDCVRLGGKVSQLGVLAHPPERVRPISDGHRPPNCRRCGRAVRRNPARTRHRPRGGVTRVEIAEAPSLPCEPVATDGGPSSSELRAVSCRSRSARCAGCTAMRLESCWTAHRA